MTEIKSGEEFLREFFECMGKISEINKKLTNKLKELYEQGKFTDTNIKNMIDKLIGEEVNNED